MAKVPNKSTPRCKRFCACQGHVQVKVIFLYGKSKGVVEKTIAGGFQINPLRDKEIWFTLTLTAQWQNSPFQVLEVKDLLSGSVI